MIELYDDNPSRIEMKEFLDQLKKSASDYLKFKYATIDRDLPVEGQIQNLNWLKSRNILTEEEYEQIKLKLTGTRSEIKGFVFKLKNYC